MTCRTVRLLLVLTVVGLLGESRACAEMVDFSYHWSVTPSAVIPSGTGNVTLALAADGKVSAELGITTASIPGVTLTTSSVATDPPDVFNKDFNLTLDITEGSETKSVTFKGTLSGTLTATTSTLISTLHDPITQEVSLGDHTYTVTLNPMLANLPPPGATAQGLIDAQVKVVANDTPEPSSLLLGATALAGLAARRLLRSTRRPRMA